MVHSVDSYPVPTGSQRLWWKIGPKGRDDVWMGGWGVGGLYVGGTDGVVGECLAEKVTFWQRSQGGEPSRYLGKEDLRQ